VIKPLLRLAAGLHENHKRIGRSALIIAALTIVAKGLVAVREIAVAWRFGISGFVDAYQVAVTATTWLPLLLNGVLIVVLVPRLVHLKKRGLERRQFIGELNGTIVISGLVLVAATWLVAPLVPMLLGSRVESNVAALAVSMTAQMAPVSLMILVASYLSARLQARERFGYTVTEGVAAVSVALFVVVPLGMPLLSALVAGTLIGYFLQLILVGGMVARSDPPIGGLRVVHRSGEWKSLYPFLFFMGVGQLLVAAGIPIDQIFAAHIGEGAIATLGYANRIILLFNGLATVVIGRALLPVFSTSVVAGDGALAKRHSSQWSLLLFGSGLFAAVIMWAFAPLVVRLLFERGAFDEQATAAVTDALRYGLLQIPPFCAAIVLVQWFAASGRFRELFVINLCSLIGKVGLNALLVPQFGVGGLLLSTALMYTGVAVTLILWRPRT
jgi:peptidoglycan biosynthesis protein MviN/MurJ (putative lipid II flippase)